MGAQLADAVARGDLDALLRAAPALDVNARTDRGDTLLTWACVTSMSLWCGG